MTNKLENQMALVTGASRGIGRSIGIALDKSGAHVLLSARNKQKLVEVQNEITLQKGKASILVMDLADEREIDDTFDRIEKQWGRLDILVNNAGIGFFEKLVDYPLSEFDKTININLRSLMQCCQRALRMMIPARSGYIINIASVQGIKGYALQSVYAASKHGVMGLTKALAVEVQEYGIRTSVILPGGVDTDLIREARPDLDPSVLMHPEDIAGTVLYLLSLSEQAMVDQIVVRRRSSSPF